MTFSKLSLGVAAASLLTVAACVAPLPDQGTTNRNQGAAVGAGVGAVLGALKGDDANDRWRNAAIGAAVGGGLGAVGGSYLDRQEAELRQSLGNNAGIVNNGQNLTVTLSQDILFGVDSASVSIASQSDLRAVAQSLNNYPNTTVNVIGHTDSTGDATYNNGLSQRRAQAVASVLVNSGVSGARVVAIGRGENQPIASNQTAEGRAKNRRVEIVITPNQ